ncbi:MAG: MATE family efflux transporter, partial [Kineothrix sp.]|nr:MATE family efflux transporter [Kineothrix sp.]
MESTITKTNPLGTERVGKLMMRYAVPSIISIVVNSLYNMVDQVFIGQGVGYLGNAATNVIMPISTIMLALGFMFGDGAAAFMSLHLGKKEPEKAAKGIGNMVAIVIGTGIVLMILFELFLTPLCRLFGATDNVLPYALDYGRIIVLGFPFSIICSAFGSPIRADGRPKISMVGLLIGCATNMILDPIFIFVCEWGVKGAAWATVLGQVLNALYFIMCLFQFKTIKIKKEYFIPDIKVVGNIASLGTSSLISQ